MFLEWEASREPYSSWKFPLSGVPGTVSPGPSESSDLETSLFFHRPHGGLEIWLSLCYVKCDLHTCNPAFKNVIAASFSLFVLEVLCLYIF